MKFDSRKLRTAGYKELISGYYTIATDSYRQVWGDFFHPAIFESDQDSLVAAFEKTHVRFMKDSLISEGKSAIDLGCGIGSYVQFLAAHSKAEITGLNFTHSQVKMATDLAKQKKTRDVRFLYGDIMDLSKVTEKYDAAFLIDVGCHLPDKKKGLKEIYDILKPGGRLIIADWLQNENPTFAENKYLIEPFNNYWHFPYMESVNGYVKIANQIGYKIIQANDVSEQTTKNWQLFYDVALSVVHKRSIRDLLTYVKNPLSLLSKKNRDIYESQFYGNIYTKICHDAGVFRYGYFVLEK